MSDFERRLELAREAFRADAPGDAEVAHAAARIGARMRSQPAARGRFVAPAIAAAALVATVAYAAARGGWRSPPRATAVTVPANPVVAPTASAPAPVPMAAPEAHGAPEEPAPPAALASPHRSSANGSTPKRAAPRPVGWSDVNAALAAHDDARARTALDALASSSDANVRAKARLGMAQLALARGDADAARSIATEVADGAGIDPKLVARARDLAARAGR